MAKFASRALGELYTAASTAYAVQALTHYQTYLGRPPWFREPRVGMFPGRHCEVFGLGETIMMMNSEFGSSYFYLPTLNYTTNLYPPRTGAERPAT